MSTGVNIEVLDSLEQISEGAWNSVAGQSTGINYRMLRCREKNYLGAGQTLYFLAREDSGLMAVSVAVVYTRKDGRVIVNRLFGRLARKLRSIFGFLDRSMVCGAVAGPGPAIVVKSGADPRRWLRVICGAMERHAKSSGLQMAYIGSLPQESDLRRELERRRYLRGADLPVSILDVTWNDMAGYIKRLRDRKGLYGSKAKAEIRRFRQSGIKITRWRGGDGTKLFDLMRSHNDRRTPGSFAYRPEFLNDLVNELGDDCIIYQARRDDVLVGACVALRRGEHVRSWAVGIDHEADGNNFTYFNLTFYHPCAEFPDLGVRRAHYGNAVQYAKYRRGCDIVQANFYVRPSSRVLQLVLYPIFLFQRSWLVRRYQTQLRLGPGSGK